jgi:hypothetical protein
MSSSLRDIPGAHTGGRRSRKDGPRRRDGGMLRPGQPQVLSGGRRRKKAFGKRTERDPFNLVIALCFVVLGVVGAVWLWNANQVSFEASGIEDGAALAPQETVGLTVTIEVSPSSRLDDATVTFDGDEDTEAVVIEANDDGWEISAPTGSALPRGEHTIEARVPRSVIGTATWTLDFTIER